MLVHFYKIIEKLKGTPARRNKIIIVSGIVSLLLNLAIWLVIYLKLKPLVINLPEEQSFIPLHYNIYLGVDRFGRWTKTFILPGIGFIFMLSNFFIALMIYNKREILSYFLSISASFIQLILLISTLLIVLINI